MRAKGVRLDDAAPVGIEGHRSRRSDAVAPVVFIRKATAGPANVRNLNGFQRSDDIIADATRVRDFGIRTDPYPLINSVSEMLGELAEEVAVDLGAGFGRIHR